MNAAGGEFEEHGFTPHSEFIIERELHPPCAGRGNRLPKACRWLRTGAEHRIDQRNAAMVDQVEGLSDDIQMAFANRDLLDRYLAAARRFFRIFR